MNNYDPDDGPLVAVPDAPKRPHGCWIVFSIFLVFVLVGTSASGAIWYFFLRERSGSAVREALVEATAVPNEATAELSLPATSVPDATAVPVPEDAVNRIVFVNGDGQLVSIDPDGSDERQLTDAQQRFQFPAWSPDGRLVAAVGADRTGAGVFVFDDSQTEAASLPLYADPRDGPFYLYWSPDSQQVSFLASHPDGMALHVVPADGSADSRLLTVGGPLYWQWTADSDQMLVHSGFAGEDAWLELITADGDSTSDSLAVPGFFQAPGISANGRYLAYAEEITGANSRLVVLDTQSDNEVQQRHAGIVALAWSPTADQLAFTNGSEPDSTSFVGPLRLLDAATGDIRVLSQEPIVAFFWSPDGRYLAAISILRSGDGDINVQSGKTAVGKRPSQGAAQQNLPRLRLLVYDVAEGEGRLLFEFVPTFTFATQFLPFFDQYALSHRLWSPQSDALVLPMVEDGRNEIFVINITTGQKRFLAEGLMPFWSPR